MEMSDRAMDLVRVQIAAQQKMIPDLYERATDLDLAPQPWWDRVFYEHAIQRREAELEALRADPETRYWLGRKAKGGDDDECTSEIS